jgi:hypothetical protein
MCSDASAGLAAARRRRLGRGDDAMHILITVSASHLAYTVA